LHEVIDSTKEINSNKNKNFDSFTSNEEKKNSINTEADFLNEKHYVEDNTKTNTDSNTPVNASPLYASHNKSIHSSKNENKELNENSYFETNSTFHDTKDNENSKDEDKKIRKNSIEMFNLNIQKGLISFFE